MIALTAGEKGGTGKTMLATNFAAEAARRHLRIKLVDLDPQGSSARWAGKRAALERADLPFVPWSQLSQNVYYALREEARHYDCVIVDVGGADTEEFEAAIACADVLLSPVFPSDCDIATLHLINDLVGRQHAQARQLAAYVVLNHVPNHAHNDEADEARFYIQDLAHLRVASTLVHTRGSFRKAYRQRVSVVELVGQEQPPWRAERDHGKARAELLSLYTEVFDG